MFTKSKYCLVKAIYKQRKELNAYKAKVLNNLDQGKQIMALQN